MFALSILTDMPNSVDADQIPQNAEFSIICWLNNAVGRRVWLQSLNPSLGT